MDGRAPCVLAAMIKEEEQGRRAWPDCGIVLVVDDNEVVRDFVVAALQLHGHHVLAASGPHQALDIYQEHADSIGVILLDVQMPEMTGVELLTCIRRRRADTPVIFMTGCSPAPLDRVVQDPCVYGILAKPFRVEDMLARVHRAMRRGAERSA